MKNEKTTRENGGLFIKIMMAVLAVIVIVLTVINSVPAFSEAKDETESGITTAAVINTEANSVNEAYYQILNETVDNCRA